MMKTKDVVHVVDVAATEAYVEREPMSCCISRTRRHAHPDNRPDAEG